MLSPRHQGKLNVKSQLKRYRRPWKPYGAGNTHIFRLYRQFQVVRPYIPLRDTVCPESRSGAQGTVSQRVIRLADQSSETLHVMPEYDRGI